MALTRNRVAPIDVPPSTLETTAANTPQTSVIANFFSPGSRDIGVVVIQQLLLSPKRSPTWPRSDVILRRRVGDGCEEAVTRQIGTWHKTAVVYHPCLATRLG